MNTGIIRLSARRRARDSRTHIVTSRRTRDAPHFAMRSAICASAPFASRGPSPRRARAPRRLPVASAARAPDDTPALVVVIGAGGRTGSEVCRHCVSLGLPVRACTRTGLADPTAILGDDAPAAVVPWSSPLVRAVAADVTVPEQLPPAVAGASLVVFAATAPAGGDPDAVDHRGLAETARARASPRAFPVSSSSPAPGSQTRVPRVPFPQPLRRTDGRQSRRARRGPRPVSSPVSSRG